MKVLRAGGALQNASRSSTISHYGFTFARRAHGVRESIGHRLSWRCVLRIHEYVSYGTVTCHDYGHGRGSTSTRRGAAQCTQSADEKEAGASPSSARLGLVRAAPCPPRRRSRVAVTRPVSGRVGRRALSSEQRSGVARRGADAGAERGGGAVVVLSAVAVGFGTECHIYVALFFSNYTHHVQRSALSTTRTRQQSQRPVLTCRATHGTAAAVETTSSENVKPHDLVYLWCGLLLAAVLLD